VCVCVCVFVCGYFTHENIANQYPRGMLRGLKLVGLAVLRLSPTDTEHC
jgi:hypothetical protein